MCVFSKTAALRKLFRLFGFGGFASSTVAPQTHILEGRRRADTGKIIMHLLLKNKAKKEHEFLKVYLFLRTIHNIATKNCRD